MTVVQNPADSGRTFTGQAVYRVTLHPSQGGCDAGKAHHPKFDLITPHFMFQHSANSGIRLATLYDIKPAFQKLLRPLAVRLVAMGVTANMVTLGAAVLSVATGAAVAIWHENPTVFWLLPLVLFVRMALNAVDGMMAREFGQKSTLGMYLNELTDVVADAALILPFALLPAFPAWGVVLFALIAVLTEFAGVLGIPAGASRRYDGPFGKSDRALALGILGALVASGVTFAGWGGYVFPALAALSGVTVWNRVRMGLKEVGK
jgi:CDP-diacylglycerol---glycerol-3-phosphate 3-phosphatidyltransferase